MDKKTLIAMGAGLAFSLSASATLAASGDRDHTSQTMQTEHKAEEKCGHGKCGSSKTRKKDHEGKCGKKMAADKTSEGKCGHGKCGGART